MEGIIELGFKITSNDFRLQPIISPDISRDKSPVFDAKNVQFTESLTGDVLIVDCSQGFGPYAERLTQLNGARMIAYLNMDDGVNFVDFPANVISFCTHQNINARRLGNIFPIPFGISNSLLNSVNCLIDDKKHSEPVVIDNFRSTFQQGVRNFCYLSLVPHLKRQLTVHSGILDTVRYRSQLASSHAVLCYGGEIFRSFENNPGLPVPSIMRDFAHLSADPVILRWDSWRFWECCAFGCAPIMLDFDHYGLVLDQNPVPFLHYIPVRFGEEKFLAEEIGDCLSSDPNFLLSIGNNARDWAMRHYSPAAIASYVLKKIQDFYNITSFSLDTPS